MMDGVDVVRRQPFGNNPFVGERGASTQRSILDAALRVFADHGFHETRVELIAEAAGCSRPAFYQYFSSKEDVFWRLAGHLARELEALVDRLGDVTPDLEGVAALAVWLDEFVGLYKAYQPVFVSFREAYRENEPSEPLPRTITTRLQEILEQASSVGATAAPDTDHQLAAEALTATILRTVHYWLLGVEQIPRARLTRGLAATVHRIIYTAMPRVNIDPLIGAPPRRAPAWPDDIDAKDPDLRPRGRVTRQQLLDAGSRVLPLRGYHETRVDDIVKEAGFSHGSFYRYFENKDDLFSVLALEAVEHLVQLVERFPRDHGDPLDEWLAEWFEGYRSKGGVISAWEEIGFAASDLVARSAEITVVYLDRLERVVAARGFGDVRVDALALLAAIEFGPHAALRQRSVDDSRLIAAVGRLIRCGILDSAGIDAPVR